MASQILPPKGTAFIPVGKSHVALVDADQYDSLSQFKWHLANGYAVRLVHEGGTKRREFMHRRINQTPEDMETDHINRNRLDNRAENLRTCTRTENSRNISPRGKSQFKGVSTIRARGSVYYRACINIAGKRKSLGAFNSEREAAMAYDNAAKHVHGEFAVLNFP